MFRVSKDIAVEMFEDRDLVFLIVPEHYLAELNPAALEVVQLRDSGKMMEEMGAILAERYEISSEQVM